MHVHVGVISEKLDAQTNIFTLLETVATGILIFTL